MLAGGRAHRSRQEQQTGEVERAIRHSFSLRGESVELYGRMDAFTDGPVPLVEEMKLSRHTGDAPLPEHRAQALLYAAMAALVYGSIQGFFRLNQRQLRPLAAPRPAESESMGGLLHAQ